MYAYELGSDEAVNDAKVRLLMMLITSTFQTADYVNYIKESMTTH